MRNFLERARVLGMIAFMAMISGFTGATSSVAHAQTQPAALPSSNTATSFTPWRSMRPSSFAGTIVSAREQCDRTAALSTTDRLTPEKCARAQQLLEVGSYQVVMVPDGMRHDYMNGRAGGPSFVTNNIEKHTGRHDRALLVDLGDGVYMYWYTGIRGQSCNNIAFSFVTPMAAPALPPPPALPRRERHCHVVPLQEQTGPDHTISVPSLFLDNTCCDCLGPLFVPGMTVNFGGVSSAGYRLVCHDVDVADSSQGNHHHED